MIDIESRMIFITIRDIGEMLVKKSVVQLVRQSFFVKKIITKKRRKCIDRFDKYEYDYNITTKQRRKLEYELIERR